MMAAPMAIGFHRATQPAPPRPLWSFDVDVVYVGFVDGFVEAAVLVGHCGGLGGAIRDLGGLDNLDIGDIRTVGFHCTGLPAQADGAGTGTGGGGDGLRLGGLCFRLLREGECVGHVRRATSILRRLIDVVVVEHR